MTAAACDAGALTLATVQAEMARTAPVIERAARRRSHRRPNHSPVRRDSRPAEAATDFYRSVTFEERCSIIDGAIAWSDAQRESGIEPLTASTKHILRTMLLRMWKWGEAGDQGVFDWALSEIAAAARRCKQTVVAALKQLADHGLVEWMRRCMPNDDPDGPPFIQTTNAYRFLMPDKIRAWLASRDEKKAAAKAAREAPPPDDAEAAATEAEAARNADPAWNWLKAHKLKELAERAHLFQGPGAAALRRRLE